MATERTIRAVVITKDPPIVTERSVRAVAIYQDPPQSVVRSAGLYAFQAVAPKTQVRSAALYAFQNSPVKAQVRNVSGYAWTAAPTKTQVRTVSGYAWQPAIKIGSLSVTSADSLLQLINNNTIKKFVAADLTFGVPGTYSDLAGNDTKVNVKANPTSGYSGNINVYYRRLPLAKAFDGTKALTAPGIDTTVYQYLANLNASFGTAFVADDLVDGPIKAGAVSVLLKAHAKSLRWAPDSVGYAGQVTALSTLKPDLPGFTDANGKGIKSTILLMHMDDASFADASGNHASTVTNVAPAAGRFGNGANFIGTTNQMISVADKADLHLKDEYTIELFYRPSSSGQRVLLSKGASQIWMNNTNAAIGVQFDQGGGNILSWGGGALPNTFHIAVVMKAGKLSLFVNGAWTQVFSGRTETWGNNASPLIIGNVAGGGSSVAYGVIDEVRLSRIARYSAAFAVPSAAFTLD